MFVIFVDKNSILLQLVIQLLSETEYTPKYFSLDNHDKLMWTMTSPIFQIQLNT